MSFMVYHQKMTWQNLPKNSQLRHHHITGAFSPASSSRLLRIACNAASEPRRQAGDRSIVRTLRVGALAALPGGARRGETMVKPHFSPENFMKSGKIYGKHHDQHIFYEDQHDQSKKIWTFEKCLPCWSGFGCEELKKSWLS
jgi:hypothetical protein